MRITQGKYKGRPIAAPPGKTTRPALGRVRLAIFDALKPWIAPGGAVLDLFAGSGAFVLEALSRGASRATAVDLDRRAADTIRDNARSLEVSEPLEVIRGDALRIVPRLAAAQPPALFDVILVAPPYWKGLQAEALARLDAHAQRLLAPEGVVVVQRDRKERIEAPPLAALVLASERGYGNTVFGLYQAAPRPDADPGTGAAANLAANLAGEPAADPPTPPDLDPAAGPASASPPPSR